MITVLSPFRQLVNIFFLQRSTGYVRMQLIYLVYYKTIQVSYITLRTFKSINYEKQFLFSKDFKF